MLLDTYIPLSPSVYKKVSASGNKRFVQWFHDVRDHWEAVVTEYENSEVF